MTDDITIDRERNAVVIGSTAMKLLDETGEEMKIDHTSSMDGYVAFRAGKVNTTVVFEDA